MVVNRSIKVMYLYESCGFHYIIFIIKANHIIFVMPNSILIILIWLDVVNNLFFIIKESGQISPIRS